MSNFSNSFTQAFEPKKILSTLESILRDSSFAPFLGKRYSDFVFDSLAHRDVFIIAKLVEEITELKEAWLVRPLNMSVIEMIQTFDIIALGAATSPTFSLTIEQEWSFLVYADQLRQLVCVESPPTFGPAANYCYNKALKYSESSSTPGTLQPLRQALYGVFRLGLYSFTSFGIYDRFAKNILKLPVNNHERNH